MVDKRKRAVASKGPYDVVVPTPAADGSNGPVSEECYDVIVVGLGPVGAFAANVLASYGLSVLALERDVGLYAAPRAVAMDDETVRLLGLASAPLAGWLQRHLYEAPLELRTGPPPSAAACLSPAGSTPPSSSSPSSSSSSFRAGWAMLGPLPPRRVEASGGGAEFAFLHQPTLERVLRERLARLHPQRGGTRSGVTVRLGWEVVRVEEEGTHEGSGGAGAGVARVSARHGPTGALATSTCGYVLGCDGGSSGVRKGLGIPFTGSSFRDEPWLVVDVESADPALAAAYPNFNFMNAFDARAGVDRCVVHVPLPGPRAGRRFEFLLERGEDPSELTADPGCVAALLLSVGVHPSRVTVVRTAGYTFHARQAEAWRSGKGRVLLLGDAAHCMPPFRGQGMCAGLRDAANLCWKVALAVRADASASSPSPSPSSCSPFSDALLGTYRPERHPHLSATTDIAITIGGLVQLRRPVWLRDARNLAIGALYRCPLTRPFFLEPFAPPTSLPAGWVDFHDRAGHRVWERSSGRGAGALPVSGGVAFELLLAVVCALVDALPLGSMLLRLLPPWAAASAWFPGTPPLPGWWARDVGCGRCVPNHTVELVHDGSATKLRLDEVLQPWGDTQQLQQCQAGKGEAGDQLSPYPARAPLWHVLVSSRLSGSGGAGKGGAPEHPLRVLDRLRAAAEKAAGNPRGGLPLLSHVVGLQLLPVTGAPSRIAAHAEARSAAADDDDDNNDDGADDGEAVVGEAARFRRAYTSAVYAPVLAAAASARALHDAGDPYEPFGGQLYYPPAAAGDTAGATAVRPQGGRQGTRSSSSSSRSGAAGARSGAGVMPRAPFPTSPARYNEGSDWFTRGDAGVADSGGKLCLWLEDHCADVAIVRPDRVVYGLYMAHEVQGALEALGAAAGASPSVLRHRLPAAAVWARWVIAQALRCAMLAVALHVLQPQGSHLLEAAVGFLRLLLRQVGMVQQGDESL